jgi:CRP/FNR family transcriptional regulator, cyclic AMP receptor protein
MSAPPAFLATLCESDLRVLAERWNVHSYQRQELIIAHGEASRDVFFVLDGHVRVTLFSASGREVAYRDIHRGDIFGELAAIDGKARSASVIATEPTRAAILSAEAFQNLLKSHPSMSWALLQHLSGLLRRMTDRVFEFSTLVVRERVICELLRRADEMGESEGGVTVIPIPRHFELAATISTHREAVSREMSLLAKKGLIKRRGDNLLLRDRAALEALTGRE